MTGADPAVEAAQRAWAKSIGSDQLDPHFEIDLLHRQEIAAAREALAPIRATLHALGEAIDALPSATRPAVFALFVQAINDIEKHTFTSEELN